MAHSRPSFNDLPSEILLHVFTYLHIPDLLQLTRTSHRLRALACDPVLHSQRLHAVPASLAAALAHRPNKAALAPPNAAIWLSRTHVLSRSINRSLTRIRLAHCLEQRPSAEQLVARAILPRMSMAVPVAPALIQCQQVLCRERLKDGLGRKLEARPTSRSLVERNILPEECVGGCVAPALVARRRQVMRERLKDGLRRWVEGRGREIRLRAEEEGEGWVGVKVLVRRFSCKAATTAGERGGAGGGSGSGWVREGVVQPTRAHVLGLRRFWEGVIRAAAV